MTNFRIEFLYPWLLLLLIPAFALAFYFYFRISKRYRRTRNRIVSMILYFICSTLSILTLAGITFSYEIPNMETEVILLVDQTYSGEAVEDQKNDFIQDAILKSKNTAQIGVVTFGYGEPVYAVPLTSDIQNAYFDYLNADLPDGTATDLASALEYAGGLFKNPEVAKIVVISDGMETDGKCANVVRELAARGIEVNAVYFPGERPEKEYQIEGVVTPDYNVVVGETFKMSVTIRSSYVGDAKLELFDNDETTPVLTQDIRLTEGAQDIEIQHVITTPELHALTLRVSSGKDDCAQNNVYQTYINIEKFNKILMVERNSGESVKLATVLKAKNNAFEIDLLNIVLPASGAQGEAEIYENVLSSVPKTVDALRQYDQVILVNIANADMPKGFDELLYAYVNDFGGGLFTVGGNKLNADGTPMLDGTNYVPNAYNKEDMHVDGEETLYQQMLPVKAIEYTPPVAVMLIIDRSGSMDLESGSGGAKKLEIAKQAARECLKALTERDYCGVVTLEEKYTEQMQVTPMTQQAKIHKAIDEIIVGGGTVFEDALRGAVKALQSINNVERRHVILITDGKPSDTFDTYGKAIEEAVNDATKKVTFSFAIIGSDIPASDRADIIKAAELGEGKFHQPADVSLLPEMIRDELHMDSIKSINYEDFQPQINIHNNVVSGISQADVPQLGGFYGTKAKQDAQVVLKGNFVPIFAQWNFGAGRVGSFMSDLSGIWSADMMEDLVGQQLILNMVNAMFPTKSIRPHSIEAELFEQNYKSQLSVYSKLQNGETIEVEILSSDKNGKLTESKFVEAEEDSNYSRFNLSITDKGVHKLIIRKKSADGNVLDETSFFKTFSYSQEFNMFSDLKDGEDLLNAITLSGDGEMMEDASEIYFEIAKTLKCTYDPRIPFMIITLCLFLTDIAVRKFKFKWPHEIIRDAKAKKLLQQKTA